MRSYYVDVFVEWYGDHLVLHVLTHSCPTRRSSELGDLHQRHQLGTGAWTMKPTFRKTGNPVLHIHSATSARGAPLVFALLGVTALAGCAGSMPPPEKIGRAHV